VEFWETSVRFGIGAHFLTYIDIDEGYAVIDYQSFSGDRLDFHQYTFRWYLHCLLLLQLLCFVDFSIIVLILSSRSKQKTKSAGDLALFKMIDILNLSF